tara:strand:+ start:2279 stop:2521 length:243 start_codon:yes stop_codon:yes gene_type:complete
MNKRQKIVLAIYSCLVFIQILYPPFIAMNKGRVYESGYSLLWSPVSYNSLVGVIDVNRLLMTLLATSLICIAVVAIFKDK